MSGGFTLCAALSLPVGSFPHRGSCQEIQGQEAAQTGTGLPIKQQKAGYETGPKFTSKHMVDGRSSTIRDGSEKESQVRHLSTESTP